MLILMRCQMQISGSLRAHRDSSCQVRRNSETISSFAFPALFETGESSKFQSVVDSIRHDVINFIFEMEVAALYEMLAVTQLSAQRGVCRFSFWCDNKKSILQFETPIVVLALRSREHFSDFFRAHYRTFSDIFSSFSSFIIFTRYFRLAYLRTPCYGLCSEPRGRFLILAE
jgi:hypothetical protein